MSTGVTYQLQHISRTSNSTPHNDSDTHIDTGQIVPSLPRDNEQSRKRRIQDADTTRNIIDTSKTIQKLKMGLFSDEQIRKMSVVEVTHATLYDNGKPRYNGPLDMRMGVSDRRLVCGTCRNKLGAVGIHDCPGHFGHIELPVPVYHGCYIKTVFKLLKLLCYWCHGLLLNKHDVRFVTIFMNEDLNSVDACNMEQLDPERYQWLKQYMAGEGNGDDFDRKYQIPVKQNNLGNLRFGAISKLKALKKCPHCQSGREVPISELSPEIQRSLTPQQREEKKIIYAAQPQYKMKSLNIVADWQKVKSNIPAELECMQQAFCARDAQAILHGTPFQDYYLLGFDPVSAHPERMILNVLLVPPPVIRPPVTASEGSRTRGQNDLTHKLQEIIKECVSIQNWMEEHNVPKILNRPTDEMLLDYLSEIAEYQEKIIAESDNTTTATTPSEYTNLSTNEQDRNNTVTVSRHQDTPLPGYNNSSDQNLRYVEPLRHLYFIDPNSNVDHINDTSESTTKTQGGKSRGKRRKNTPQHHWTLFEPLKVHDNQEHDTPPIIRIDESQSILYDDSSNNIQNQESRTSTTSGETVAPLDSLLANSNPSNAPQQTPPNTAITGQKKRGARGRPSSKVNLICGIPENEYIKLQMQVITYMDNEINGVKTSFQRSGAPTRGIVIRFKGKYGRPRFNLMGKRGDFTARTVISPDPQMNMDEIGIPYKCAKTLTIPEIVNRYNIESLQRRVLIGPDDYRGAKTVILEDGRMIQLKHCVDRSIIQLRYGWKVERFLQNGDRVVFNRQPSLHRISMMGHKVRLMHGSTFRLNLSSVEPYNADFDGDEMNLHVPQSMSARAEVQHLMSVPRQILNGQANKPSMGIVQDALVGAFLFTLKDQFFDHNEACQLAAQIKHVVEGKPFYRSQTKLVVSDHGSRGRKSRQHKRLPPIPGTVKTQHYEALSSLEKERFYAELPVPAILKPRQLWTGKQIFSILIPSNIYLERCVRDFDRDLVIEDLERQQHHQHHHHQQQQQSDAKLSKSVVDCALYSDTQERAIVIQGGELLVGSLCKQTLGRASNGLVHVMGKDSGAQRTANFLSDTQHLINYWMMYYGLTVSANSCKVEDPKVMEYCKRMIKETESEINMLTNSKVTGVTSRQIEQLATSNLGKLLKQVGDTIQNTQNVRKDHIHAMMISGSKGTSINGANLTAFVGQQNVEGVRIRSDIEDRTLTCYIHEENTPPSRGMIGRSYTSGLRQDEYYHHTMSGREGLVDTAVKTSETGYLQRKLSKSTECIAVRYDYTVRDADNRIIELASGGDSMDSSLLERTRSKWLTQSDHDFYRHFVFDCLAVDDDNLDNDVDNITIPTTTTTAADERRHYYQTYIEYIYYRKLLSGNERKAKTWRRYGFEGFKHLWNDYLESEYTRLLELRNILRRVKTNAFTNEINTTISVPINVERVLHNFVTVKPNVWISRTLSLPLMQTFIRQCKMGESDQIDWSQHQHFEPMLNAMELKDALDGVEKHIRAKSPRDSNCEAFIFYLHCTLSTRNLILNPRQCCRKELRALVSFIREQYEASLISPGEMTGPQAAESIGEPSTQMTLNTFHLPGVVEKNVTLGIPALRMTFDASQDIKNPSTTVRLRAPFNQSKRGATIACFNLEHVTLKDVIEVTKLLPLDDMETTPLARKINYIFGLEFNTSSQQQGQCNSTHVKDLWSTFCKNQQQQQESTELTNHRRRRQQQQQTCSVTFPWCIEMKLKKKKLLLRNQSPQDIEHAITRLFENPTPSPSSSPPSVPTRRHGIDKIQCSTYMDNEWYIHLTLRQSSTLSEQERIEREGGETEEKILNIKREILQNIETWLLNNTFISGVPGIKHTHCSESSTRVLVPCKDKKTCLQCRSGRGLPCYKLESRREWSIDTSGNALSKILGLPFVDPNRTFSNNIHEIFRLLGIEAATTFLFNRLRNIVSFDGNYVDDRHYALIVNKMTSSGHVMALNRHGLNRQDSGPLAKCSFEESTDIIFKAAGHGATDYVVGTSENIMMGRPIPGGTGIVHILNNADKDDDTKRRGVRKRFSSSSYTRNNNNRHGKKRKVSWTSQQQDNVGSRSKISRMEERERVEISLLSMEGRNSDEADQFIKSFIDQEARSNLTLGREKRTTPHIVPSKSNTSQSSNVDHGDQDLDSHSNRYTDSEIIGAEGYRPSSPPKALSSSRHDNRLNSNMREEEDRDNNMRGLRYFGRRSNVNSIQHTGVYWKTLIETYQSDQEQRQQQQQCAIQQESSETQETTSEINIPTTQRVDTNNNDKDDINKDTTGNKQCILGESESINDMKSQPTEELNTHDTLKKSKQYPTDSDTSPENIANTEEQNDTLKTRDQTSPSSSIQQTIGQTSLFRNLKGLERFTSMQATIQQLESSEEHRSILEHRDRETYKPYKPSTP